MLNIVGNTTGSRRVFITVTITFSEANNVQGATVNVNGTKRETDSNGKAQFKLSPNREYDYTITKSGYEDYTGTLVVGESNFTESVTLLSETQILNFVTTETGQLSGSITLIEGDINVNYDA